MSLSIEQSLGLFNEDQSSYLERMWRRISKELNRSDQFVKRDVLPSKPIVGKVYYFNSAIGPITAEGWWGYKSTGWVQLG